MAEETRDYDFKEAEARIRGFWEKENIFKFKFDNKKKLFVIDNPPPTISGKMHIGHAFQYSQMDFIARFKRMQGYCLYYPFGTDDNGLPTERLVEKINNVKSKSMKRQEFIALCLKTLKEITPGFIQDWKNTAISADYSSHYSTIDRNSQRLCQKSFIQLFGKNEVYKKDFPSLWCPECQTAIAQAELEDKEFESLFSTLKFSADKKELLIATTRPELLGACVAVFVNSNDKRYKQLVGKKVRVPLFNFEVPIIADESADMKRGTGAMMICSYGDKYDAEAINRHKLSSKLIIDKMGMINYNGEMLKIKATRKKILEDLGNAGLIKEQKKIKHSVNVHERCGTEVEILSTEQWFIKLLDKKKKLLEQTKKINWHPEFMRKRCENWISGLQWDWNISRDRHFGIPIPAWHCRKCDKIIVAEEKELPIDPSSTKKKCSCGSYAEPETKVFDTWQTSSISPQIIFSLTKEKLKLPCALRCNGHDIIRTWDFYTIAKSFMHENEIPWKDLMISGFITLGGEKMSKSKGNTISPQEITDNFGADSLRYWAASAKLGEDLDYQEKEVLSGKKFVTKIWNATKFVFMNLEKSNSGKLEELDRLFLVKLNSVIKNSTESFESFEYARAKSETDSFFWRTFCDNYLEIVKRRVYNGNREEKQSAFYTLYNSLLTILKLMAPFTPYITEELYQLYFKKYEKDKSIHISSWPEKFKIKENKDDEEKLELLLEVISKVRMEKSKAQKSMKAEIILTLEKEKTNKLEDVMLDLKAVLGAREIKSGKFEVKFI